MLIDWFTVFAQIVNFLILVALLKRFLYRPVIKAMDERSEMIAAQLEEAERKKQAADDEAAAYREKNKAFEIQQEAMLAQVTEDVEVYRKELISAARSEIDGVKSKWREAVQHEHQSFLHDLRRRAVQEIHNIVRRVLTDLADEDLERRVMTTFIKLLEHIGEEDRRAIASFVKQSGQGAVILSVYNIPAEIREQIKTVLRDRVMDSIQVDFTAALDVICGIELQAGGYKIAWHIEDYLETLETRISETLEEEAG